jgi:ribonucleoside-diphosphate reductase alpha chain
MTAPKRPARVRRRDGTLAAFDSRRIYTAVWRAAREVRADADSIATTTKEAVIADLLRLDGRHIPTVEQIQDLVVEELARSGHHDVADAYSRYRMRRTRLREAKMRLGIRDELKLGYGAALVLKERYLRRNQRGEVVESTGEMMDRVAAHVSGAEGQFSPSRKAEIEEKFSKLLRSLRFLPNSPTLMNSGTRMGLLSGCFVLPIEDSLRSIFETLTLMALVHQAGGGTGFSFSSIRPAGDIVASTGGKASGPLSFLRVYDAVTDAVKQGGRRRGANMAVLDVSHPDILDFIRAKTEQGELENFNLSVAVTDSFMRKALSGDSIRLVNPRNGRTTARVDASEILASIAEVAWASGDPGLLFIDEINRRNPLLGLGRIVATNPCGEVPLLPYESCNLGSVNLARHISNGKLDWKLLGETIRTAVRFLDDVIEVNRYPDDSLDEAARRSRKIGLGVMGLAETLAVLGIPYDSETAIRTAGRIAAFINKTAHRASEDLAVERGPFPLFEMSTYYARNMPPLRNAQLTSVAPTGTISLIAGTTSGIEPLFAIGYSRRAVGTQLTEINPHFERLARDRGFYSDELMDEIAVRGGVRDNPAVPADVRKAFVTALEIAPIWHLRMQATFQRHTDAAVSKTVNLPEHVTPADIKDIYIRAWRSKVKGITVYRYGSRPNQVLEFIDNKEGTPNQPIRVSKEFSGGCIGHVCEF